VLTDVQRDIQMMVGQLDPISTIRIVDSFEVVQLVLNPRGIGWTHEPLSTLPPHPNLTRVQFLKSRFQTLVVYALVNDVASILIRTDPRAYLAKDSSPLAEQSHQL
jgi:hypothetical protein